MKQNTIRKTCQVVPVLLITGALAACDAHIEEPDKTVRPGHVLCVDGKAVPYSEYENSGKQAIAVVFHTYSDGETEGNGYAVYLWDMTVCPLVYWVFLPATSTLHRTPISPTVHSTRMKPK